MSTPLQHEFRTHRCLSLSRLILRSTCCWYIVNLNCNTDFKHSVPLLHILILMWRTKRKRKRAVPFDEKHEFSVLVCGSDDALWLWVRFWAGGGHLSLLGVSNTVTLLPVYLLLALPRSTQQKHKIEDKQELPSKPNNYDCFKHSNNYSNVTVPSTMYCRLTYLLYLSYLL